MSFLPFGGELRTTVSAKHMLCAAAPSPAVCDPS